MDSDRVLVMDAGRMVEFDHPYELLKLKKGYLRKLVDQTGPSNTLKLEKIAEYSYERKLAL